MCAARFRYGGLRAVQTVSVAAVCLMACWNAYICLRLRPDAVTTIINLSFWLVPILVLLALTGRVWRSLALGTTFTFALQRLHWVKWRYLEQTWTAADFHFLADVSNWLLFWSYPEMRLLVVGGLAAVLTAWFLVPAGPTLRWRPRVAASLAAAVLVAGVVSWRDRHPFDPFGFNRYGHFASLVYSSSIWAWQPQAIEGTSALFLSRSAALRGDAPPPAPARPPLIVVWLQESSMDLRLFDVPNARLPVLDMYDPDGRTRAHGRLRVHSWGGSTWLSEFALLAGLSHEDFGAAGSSVYYTIVPNVRHSLPKLLRRHGYRSVAISGVPKGLYNMEAAQRHLGVDEVLNPLDFPEWGAKSLTDNLISDDELGRYAQQVIERFGDRPLFLFVLSMMQHGPYVSTYPVRHGLDRAGLTRDQAARTSDYVDRMVATNAAMRAFGGQLLERAEPVVFAYFGDHQPNLEGALPYAAHLLNPRYLTSYVVKTNFAVEAEVRHRSPLDIAFLGSVVLEHAGIPRGAFFGANGAMRRLCDGRLTDCPDRALVDSYRAHLYRDLEAVRRK